MAKILLNDRDQQRRRRLKSRLQGRGHKVWTAQQLSEINAIVNEQAIDLMIIDLDMYNLDVLGELVEERMGAKIVFQSANSGMRQDFRTWMADSLISKNENTEYASAIIDGLLGVKTPSVSNLDEAL